MQDRHERHRAESVMLGPAFQASWVTEKLHDKSRILPDPDIFTFDMGVVETNDDKTVVASFHFAGLQFLHIKFPAHVVQMRSLHDKTWLRC